ncbi:MAG: acyltransferase [Deltaproteobacteria bacterium]|nr:acyltransferase [Deltaproteobacteria bacterium]
MLIGVYQSQPVFGEVNFNVEQVSNDLPEGTADLWVLPELFNSGYQFASKEEVADLAEEIPGGRTCRAMINLAARLRAVLVFGMAERANKVCYNSAAVVGPRGFIGFYRKVHLFAEEKKFFEPGDTGFQVFDAGQAKVGVMICFDWIFPESARILALLGADIICHPSNLVLPYCQKAMVTRSLENAIYTATANRLGSEARGGKKPLTFTGGSQIIGPSGQVLSRLNDREKGWAVAEINVEEARDKKITDYNDLLGDRKPEFYGRLCE